MGTVVEPIAESDNALADACLRCSYDLRGILDDQPCPECGLLAERSRNQSRHLHDAPPSMIRRLAIGTHLMLGAVLLGVGSIIYLSRSAYAIYTASPSTVAWYYTGHYLTAVAWIIGIWLITSRGPRHQADAQRRLRICLRFVALLTLPCAALMTINTIINFTPNAWPVTYYSWQWTLYEWSPYIVYTFVWITFAFNSVLGFLLLRRLAQRVLNSNLAEHSAIVGFALAITSAVVAIMIFFSDWIDDHHPFSRKTWGLVSVAIIGAVLSTLLTFGLWSLLNLLRFVIAFTKAHRESRRRWQDADQSIVKA